MWLQLRNGAWSVFFSHLQAHTFHPVAWTEITRRIHHQSTCFDYAGTNVAIQPRARCSREGYHLRLAFHERVISTRTTVVVTDTNKAFPSAAHILNHRTEDRSELMDRREFHPRRRAQLVRACQDRLTAQELSFHVRE